MDYDKIFETDINKKFFFTDYPGDKLMVGKISLENATARLGNHEYYAFVTYRQGQKLPEQYVPLGQFGDDSGTLYATINPNLNLPYICENGGIQRLSRLPNTSNGSPNYLLGPGPEKISLETIVGGLHQKFVAPPPTPGRSR